VGEWTSAVLIALPEPTGYTDRWRTVSYDDLSVETALAQEQPPRAAVDHLAIYAPADYGVWREHGRVPLAGPR
jgi:hypothetical protein